MFRQCKQNIKEINSKKNINEMKIKLGKSIENNKKKGENL